MTPPHTPPPPGDGATGALRGRVDPGGPRAVRSRVMPMGSSSEDLAVLRELVAAEEDVAAGLDEYCLILLAREQFDDWVGAQPRRGEPFASDGSEAEFCLTDDGVVLMYVPLADAPHLVVGEDLLEFLALLVTAHPAGLSVLAYRGLSAANAAAMDASGRSGAEAFALARLAERFDLRPWPALRPRLDELQDRLPGPRQGSG